MTMDLASLDTVAACDKPAEIELLHPITNVPLGMFISVVGKHSNIFRDHVKKNVNKSLREQAVAQKRGKMAEVQTVEGAEKDAIDLLVSCTTGFRDVVFNGPLEFSPDNARKLYTESLWVREQIDAAIGDLENFMQG